MTDFNIDNINLQTNGSFVEQGNLVIESYKIITFPDVKKNKNKKKKTKKIR